MTKKNKMEWMAERARLEKASELAGEILGVAQASILPIDPFKIAEAEAPRLQVIGDDFRNRFDGQLEYHAKQQRFLLFVNTKYDTGLPRETHHPRTRFSIAHELGHFYLDKHRAYLLADGEPHRSKGEFATDRMMEREADAFAASLLMPRKFLKPLVNQDELSLARIKELAVLFNSSLVSTSIQSVQASDFPCAVAGIREGRVAWSFLSPPLIEGGCYPVNGRSLASPTAIRRWQAFSSGVFEQVSAQASIESWFEIYDRDDLQGVPVMEEFLPVPAMDTLLVILSIPEEEMVRDDEDDDIDED